MIRGPYYRATQGALPSGSFVGGLAAAASQSSLHLGGFYLPLSWRGRAAARLGRADAGARLGGRAGSRKGGRLDQAARSFIESREVAYRFTWESIVQWCKNHVSGPLGSRATTIFVACYTVLYY